MFEGAFQRTAGRLDAYFLLLPNQEISDLRNVCDILRLNSALIY